MDEERHVPETCDIDWLAARMMDAAAAGLKSEHELTWPVIRQWGRRSYWPERASPIARKAFRAWSEIRSPLSRVITAAVPQNVQRPTAASRKMD